MMNCSEMMMAAMTKMAKCFIVVRVGPMMMVIVMTMVMTMTTMMILVMTTMMTMTTMGKCHVATRVGPTNDGFLPTGPLL